VWPASPCWRRRSAPSSAPIRRHRHDPGQISGLLDESITGLTIREGGPPAIDLSKINFEALAQRFKASKHKNTDLEALKAAIRPSSRSWCA
jgi:hypothetical protein